MNSDRLGLDSAKDRAGVPSWALSASAGRLQAARDGGGILFPLSVLLLWTPESWASGTVDLESGSRVWRPVGADLWAPGRRSGTEALGAWLFHLGPPRIRSGSWLLGSTPAATLPQPGISPGAELPDPRAAQEFPARGDSASATLRHAPASGRTPAPGGGAVEDSLA